MTMANLEGFERGARSAAKVLFLRDVCCYVWPKSQADQICSLRVLRRLT
jgi:hypothetical protein